ncbi:FAD binding domain-containing protein [Lentinula edodes]|uniref:FAD binding domain-containing protein n=1 Tax=Lentinula edodes TaxID=5353 RepID=UPI001E8D5ECE|nr:FAD binding domain-containing protein [Lentinula edodes]KAH7877009.1 FAD binding domain-containing protein [Lentinula edodes]
MSSTTSISPAVLIVGAGPVGSVLALTLLKNGIPVRIIDKAGPQIGQKGAGIQPRTLEMHHFLGTLPDFLSVAQSMPPCTIYKIPGGTEILKTFELNPHEEPKPDTPYINPMVLGQYRQQSILHRHLKKYGCEVEFHTELRSFEQSDDHVLANIMKKSPDGAEIPEEIKIPYLVGADGAHSTIRRALGLTFLGDTRDDVSSVIGDIEIKSGLNHNTWHFWGEGSTKMQVYYSNSQVDNNIFTMMVTGKELDHAKTASGRDELVKTITFVTERNDIEFGDLIWMSHYRPNIRMVNKFGEGRVFVAGDAAHVHSPAGGQGTNSGVQDSFNLGWKLALVLKGLSPPSLLNTYTEERLPVIAAMLGKSTNLLNQGKDKPAADESKWKRGTEFKQLGVNYRGSSTLIDETADLTKDLIRSDSYSLASDGVIHAGDRAPQAPDLEDLHANRTLTSLFDIFGPDHHTVLIFSSVRFKGEEITSGLSGYSKGLFKIVLILPAFSESESIASVKQSSGFDLVLRDASGHAYKGYPTLPGPCTVIVVRPDGVIGAIVRGIDGLLQYVNGVFVALE